MELAFTAGMLPGDFWEATIGEIIITAKAYKIRNREAWRMTRTIAYTNYCGWGDPDNRLTMQEYLPLEGEESDKTEQQSEDELMALYLKGLNQFKDNKIQ